MQTHTEAISAPRILQPDAESVARALSKRHFATLATTSAAGNPHIAGVLYEHVDNALYINTLRTSRKARNIAHRGRAAICVPVRRLPVGPPSTIHFQADAKVLDLDDSNIATLIAAGELKSLTSHGELLLADGCFLKVVVPSRVLTYGLGLSLRKLIADPLNASGSVEL